MTWFYLYFHYSCNDNFQLISIFSSRNVFHHGKYYIWREWQHDKYGKASVQVSVPETGPSSEPTLPKPEHRVSSALSADSSSDWHRLSSDTDTTKCIHRTISVIKVDFSHAMLSWFWQKSLKRVSVLIRVVAVWRCAGMVAMASVQWTTASGLNTAIVTDWLTDCPPRLYPPSVGFKTPVTTCFCCQF